MSNEKDRFSTRSSEYQGLSNAAKMTRCAKTLFGAYQRDKFGDPDSFALQTLMVFQQYELAVAEYLTDPRNGDALQHRHPTFPPTVGEIRLACEDRTATLARLRQPRQPMISRPYVPPSREPGARARVFVGQDIPQYAELEQLATSGELDPLDWRFGELQGKAGLWVSLTVWDTRYTLARRSSTFHRMTDDELRAHYGQIEAELAGKRRADAEGSAT